MELEYYGGDGFYGLNDQGVYEVTTYTCVKQFRRLFDAKKYYDSLNEAKSFWDLRNGHGAELIDCWTEKN